MPLLIIKCATTHNSFLSYIYIYTNEPLVSAASGSYHVASIKFCISLTKFFITSKLIGFSSCWRLTSS